MPIIGPGDCFFFLPNSYKLEVPIVVGSWHEQGKDNGHVLHCIGMIGYRRSPGQKAPGALQWAKLGKQGPPAQGDLSSPSILFAMLFRHTDFS